MHNNSIYFFHLSKDPNQVLNPFSPDGTLKCRFENFLIFIWKGRGAQIPMSDATMRR